MIRLIIEKIKRRLGIKRSGPFDPAAYWSARARLYGKRAVVNTAHGDFDAVTERDKNEIFPFLRKSLNGSERTVLDFGCGCGRFTGGLAELIGGEAVGVDPTPELIAGALKHPRARYAVLADGGIPLADGSADVVWIYGVLGCVPQAALAHTLGEIDRVLAAGGLLIVTENTTEKADTPYYTYRSAEQYRTMFPTVALHQAHEYIDEGKSFRERFSVLVGRKPPLN